MFDFVYMQNTTLAPLPCTRTKKKNQKKRKEKKLVKRLTLFSGKSLSVRSSYAIQDRKRKISGFRKSVKREGRGVRNNPFVGFLVN